MDTPFFTPPPRILAHRGDSANHPENTLPAFLSAAELGVDVIETDMHLTADGRLVIWHDDTLDRGTNGTGPVEHFTLDALRTLDAGYAFSPDGGRTFPFRGQGIRIMLLEEALEALPHMRFNIDMKTDDSRIATAFAQVIRETGAHDRVLGASFHLGNLKVLRQELPELPTSFAPPEVIRLLLLQRLGLLPRRIRAAEPQRALQVPEVQGRIKVVTRGSVKAFQAMGIAVHVWTVNEPLDMHRLLDMGVDGIFTDDPRTLLAVLRDRSGS